MSRFDWIIVAGAMMIAGYESMSLIGGVAEFLSARREPSIERPRLDIHTPSSEFGAATRESTSRFGITRISEVEYDVDTSTNWPLDDYCGASPFVRWSKNGKCDGFKFITVSADSVYATLGFQRGDIIHYVNGFAICSVELMLTAYQHRHDAKYLDVEFERRGAILKRRYWLR
jgi:hypothetical protein